MDSVKMKIKGRTPVENKIRQIVSGDISTFREEYMKRIALYTYNPKFSNEIMHIINKRLYGKAKKWCKIYKTLILLEYLMKSSCEEFVFLFRKNLQIIDTLKEFSYYEGGMDLGESIRDKARDISALLRDDVLLNMERERILPQMNLARRKTIPFSGYSPSRVQVINETRCPVEEPQQVLTRQTLSNYTDCQQRPTFNGIQNVSLVITTNSSHTMQLVKQATSNDASSPSNSIIMELAYYTNDPMVANDIIKILMKRLNKSSSKWRCIYKTLELIEYLIISGSTNFVMQCYKNINNINLMKNFSYSENGLEIGYFIRDKAVTISNLLQDKLRFH